MNTEDYIKQFREKFTYDDSIIDPEDGELIEVKYIRDDIKPKKFESFLRSTITSIQREDRKEWIDKATDLWKYLLMLQMKSSEANTEASIDEWNLLETIKEKIDEEFFIDYSLQSPVKSDNMKKNEKII